VGLDPEATIQEFLARFPDDESVTAGHAAIDHVEDRQAHESDQRMASTFLRLVLVSVPLAGVVLYWATTGASRSGSQPATPAAPLSDVRPDITVPVRQADPVGPTDAVGTAAPAAPVAVAAPATEFTMTLEAVRPCWVSIVADGQQVLERLLAVGEREIVTVRRNVTLEADDASAVTMTLDGRPARGLGGTGEAVALQLTLENFQDYLAIP
jgi:cytoskeletal protein RodZ